jgi:hypothetical protein
MSVGTGWVVRSVKITSFGGSTLAGVLTKDFSIAISNLDTSDDSSGGNAEYLSEPARIDETMSVSGISKNLDLLLSIKTNVKNGQNVYATVITFPDGTTTPTTWTGDIVINSFNIGNPKEELGTYEMECAFSGESTVTAAT